MADHIREILVTDDRMIIWGSGGTLRKIGEMNGFEPTTLGIDATTGKEQVGTDLSESDLLELLSEHDGPTTLLLSPMGGQGFLIGRGNLQLSPQVLRLIGIDKRIETGDSELDAEFAAMRYMKVLQGYRTTRVLPVAVD